jgi:DDE superfamily endonuclease
MFVSPNILRDRGLAYAGTLGSWSTARKEKYFRKHYGSSSLDLASMWYDLCNTNIIESRLSEKEQCEQGLIMFCMAHHFLKVYPPNSEGLAHFPVGLKKTNGKRLWHWIEKMQGLKAEKIVWIPDMDHPASAMFAVTVDGTDMKWKERRHPTLPVDRSYYSFKPNACALKYELAISLYSSKLVWMNGPFRGGEHDLTIFRGGLKDRLQASGKIAIADSGYKSNEPDEMEILATPNTMDSKELHAFKSRARCRHETFNGRIKNFAVLRGTFRHDEAKFKSAFEAVCVIVQYQMDNGSELFPL